MAARASSLSKGNSLSPIFWALGLRVAIAGELLAAKLSQITPESLPKMGSELGNYMILLTIKVVEVAGIEFSSPI